MLKLFSKKPIARDDFVLDLNGQAFTIKVNNNPRAKRLTLRLNNNGNSASISTPTHVSNDQVAQFLARNKTWLEVRVAKMPGVKTLGEGEMITIEGLNYKITHLDRRRGIVETKEIAGEHCLLVPGEADHIPKKVLAYLKKLARARLDSAVMTHANALEVQPKSIRITDSKTRWGSCSTTRTLSFSWRIIMAPPPVLNYLAAHEVAHLREMNHSERFWRHVETICPDMNQQKIWLRKNAAQLHRIILD